MLRKGLRSLDNTVLVLLPFLFIFYFYFWLSDDSVAPKNLGNAFAATAHLHHQLAQQAPTRCSTSHLHQAAKSIKQHVRQHVSLISHHLQLIQSHGMPNLFYSRLKWVVFDEVAWPTVSHTFPPPSKDQLYINI